MRARAIVARLLACVVVFIGMAGCAPGSAAPADSPLPGSIGAVAAARGADIVITTVSQAAREAGLRVGDVVRAYNGAKVTSVRQFERLVVDTSPGSVAKLEILREGKPLLLELPVRQLDMTRQV